MSKDTIDQKRITQTLISNANKGYNIVNLHGGEATAYKGFWDVLQQIKNLGYPSISLQTNGRRMKNFEFTSKLKFFNVVLVIVSLHGGNAYTHDFLTRENGSFDDAIEGIKNALKAGINVRTNTVITKQNIGELSQLIDLLKDIGVKFVNISNIHPVGSAYINFEDVVPNVHDSKIAVTNASKIAIYNDMNLTLEGFPYCITPDLDQYHVEEKRSEINMEFRGNKIEDYFNFMSSLRIKGSVCKNCKYEHICSGVYKEYIEKRGWSEFEDSTIFSNVHLKTVI